MEPACKFPLQPFLGGLSMPSASVSAKLAHRCPALAKWPAMPFCDASCTASHPPLLSSHFSHPHCPGGAPPSEALGCKLCLKLYFVEN